jgi:uncharacterized membrane protein YqaE (UPF0057 family)
MPWTTIVFAFIGSVASLGYLMASGIQDRVLWINAILSVISWTILFTTWVLEKTLQFPPRELK